LNYFYFTYEELKLIFFGILAFAIGLFLLYLWGIETNRTSPVLGRNLEIFTLPMRNWNDIINDIFLPDRPFLLYLWGIETNILFSRPYPGWSIFTLPMRNWNTNTRCVNRMLCEIFTLPMRNWNVCFQIRVPCLSPSFLLYLWGIETIC